jgi:NAD(P)-dependent dehydrogenase (short-subunit alcohol dehydrogenase family)
MMPVEHVVITGVYSGLGRAMAIGFAADGWVVSGCGTDATALQSLADELGPGHHVQICNVTDPASVEDFSAAALGCHGTPNLLINNAALITLPDKN